MAGARGGSLAEYILVQHMRTYASSVLYPAQALKQAGLLPRSSVGDLPLRINRPGLGRRFSLKHRVPVLLGASTPHDDLVEAFDQMGELYDLHVQRYSRPIFDEAIKELTTFLTPDARLLDAGCGAGRELCRVAHLVPDGEVVGIDLAAGMVTTAHRAAMAQGLDNTACIQADAGALPGTFDGQFDLVYNSLTHHHYPNAEDATAAIFRALRPGGIYCIIDSGPAWFVSLAAPIAHWGDPGWIGYHTPERFDRLLANAGFKRTSWVDLLPGFGIAMGQKAL